MKLRNHDARGLFTLMNKLMSDSIIVTRLIF